MAYLYLCYTLELDIFCLEPSEQSVVADELNKFDVKKKVLTPLIYLSTYLLFFLLLNSTSSCSISYLPLDTMRIYNQSKGLHHSSYLLDRVIENSMAF